ncbi:hypothetical protein F5141DRAFT_1095960 [Pisolithus sp. B1]|nr:hypothetical protein F5141DRAFT_1095960 [Pisolithus sp. B1]
MRWWFLVIAFAIRMTSSLNGEDSVVFNEHPPLHRNHSTGHCPRSAPGNVALKPRRTPAFTKLTHADDKETSSTSLTTLRATFKPLSTSSEKLRSIPKPPPFPTHPKPTTPLKPLALPPPVPVQPPPSPSKDVKTILATGVRADLLALFLQQQGHAFTSFSDQELQRDTTVSPRKQSYGEDPNGRLTERAPRHFPSKQTNFTLWKCQIEKKLEPTSTAASDMQLRILKIFQVIKTPEKPRSMPVARSGLALCRLAGRHKLADDLTTGTYVVLFSFAPTDCGSGSTISSSAERDVWMSWHKVDVSSVGDTEVQRILLQFDALNPPHILLIMSKFRVRSPRHPSASGPPNHWRGSSVATCEKPLYFLWNGRDGNTTVPLGLL